MLRQVRPENRVTQMRSIMFAGLAVVAACDERPSPQIAASVRVAPPSVVPSSVETPMFARVSDSVDTLHGVPLPDPYRWLEDTLSHEGREWVAGQSAFAANVLALVVGRD